MKRCYGDIGCSFRDGKMWCGRERGAHFRAHVPHARSACARMYWKPAFVWFAPLMPEASGRHCTLTKRLPASVQTTDLPHPLRSDKTQAIIKESGEPLYLQVVSLIDFTTQYPSFLSYHEGCAGAHRLSSPASQGLEHPHRS